MFSNLQFLFSALIYSLNRDKITMRDNRGVNRMVEVLNSGIETGNSSNLIPKSSLSVDASVLKERNTNDSTSDSTKPHANDVAKESKTNDSRETKLNAQCASDSNVNKHQTNQRTSNNLMMSLDLDELDYDDDEKCAKTLTSEGENDSQNTLMDVDEPNENLYVTPNKSKQYDQSKENANDKSADDAVTIDSEEESNKRSEQEHESGAVVVNGINKYNSSSTDDVDKNNAKSVDNTVKATTSKSMKRKMSVSSDEDQQPPAKK